MRCRSGQPDRRRFGLQRQDRETSAGAIITAVSTNVETAITGSTPAFSIGTTAGGAEIVTTVALTAGSLNTVPLAALVQPLAADTDVYANITGTAIGDAYVMVQFYKFGPT